MKQKILNKIFCCRHPGDNPFYSNIDSMPDIRPRRKSIPLVSDLVSQFVLFLFYLHYIRVRKAAENRDEKDEKLNTNVKHNTKFKAATYVIN